jgi:hypothetical protein
MLVVGIIGLMSGLIVSRLDIALPAYRLRTAGRAIASTVSWVRSETISRGQSMAIRYDLDRGLYWLALSDERGRIADDLEPYGERFHLRSLPEGIRLEQVSLYSGRKLTNGNVTVRFSFLGACEGHALHLAGPDGRAFTVEVLPLGTQVNLYDYRKEVEDG